MSAHTLSTKGGSSGVGRTPAPPPPFLVKLLQMLSAEECEPYVAWSSEGTHIILRQVDKLGSEVLPKFFRHNKFTSYLRQLHIYGFKKVKQSAMPGVDASTMDQGSMAFANPLFCRGIDANGLRSIKRKQGSNNSAAGSANSAASKASGRGAAFTHTLPPHIHILHPTSHSVQSGSSGQSTFPPAAGIPALWGSDSLDSLASGNAPSDSAAAFSHNAGLHGRLAPWGVGITGVQAQALSLSGGASHPSTHTAPPALPPSSAPAVGGGGLEALLHSASSLLAPPPATKTGGSRGGGGRRGSKRPASTAAPTGGGRRGAKAGRRGAGEAASIDALARQVAAGEERVAAMEAANEVLADRNAAMWKQLGGLHGELGNAQALLQRMLAAQTAALKQGGVEGV